MRKKILSLILCITVILSAASLAGCGESKSADVYFLNFKPESADVYKELHKNTKRKQVYRSKFQLLLPICMSRL